MKKEIGILCHITSLPSIYVVGDFGKAAYKFVDFLAKNEVSIWQILPLNQTGETNCPYYSNCSFSYDEMFFDVDDLIARKLITKKDASNLLKSPKQKKVVYDTTKKEKSKLFEKAYNNMSKELATELNDFLNKNEEVYNYAIYKALLEKFNTQDWRTFDKPLLDRDSKKYCQFVKNNKHLIFKYGFYQYILDLQWKRLKAYANKKGVKILGDLPIYPNVMSFDVYCNPSAYQLDNKFNMLCTGGVPKSSPDENEQNWGSSVYDWNYLKKNNYQYLINKIKLLLDKFDILRLDHFYGYVEHYEYSTIDSKNNKWVKAGGNDFFVHLSKQIDMNKIVVENLGFSKKECDKVLQKFNLTGMCLLQDALKDNRYLPSNVEVNNIYYLGTHDNDTFIGYFNHLNEQSKNKFCTLLNLNKNTCDKKILLSVLRQVYFSKAKYDIFQIQDLLMQNSFYRMNVPGIAFNQWEYKMPKNYKNIAKKTLKLIKK